MRIITLSTSAAVAAALLAAGPGSAVPLTSIRPLPITAPRYNPPHPPVTVPAKKTVYPHRAIHRRSTSTPRTQQ